MVGWAGVRGGLHTAAQAATWLVGAARLPKQSGHELGRATRAQHACAAVHPSSCVAMPCAHLPPGRAPHSHPTGHASPAVTHTPRPRPSLTRPSVVLLAGSDAASSMVDERLPLLLAAGAATALGSAVAGNRLLLPRLRQLPSKAVEMEYLRQTLLGQYAEVSAPQCACVLCMRVCVYVSVCVRAGARVRVRAYCMGGARRELKGPPTVETSYLLPCATLMAPHKLVESSCNAPPSLRHPHPSIPPTTPTPPQLGTKVEAVLVESSDDVRVLARLWQLQNKMQSVGGGRGIGGIARYCILMMVMDAAAENVAVGGWRASGRTMTCACNLLTHTLLHMPTHTHTRPYTQYTHTRAQVGGSLSASYGARMARITGARANTEQRLAKVGPRGI